MATTSTSSVSSEDNSDIYFHIKVRRDHLVEDAIRRLRDVMTSSPHQLRKPLRVTFIGEDGVDEGGLSKEFCTLLFKKLVMENGRETTTSTNNSERKTDGSGGSSDVVLSNDAGAPSTPPEATIQVFDVNDIAVYSASNGKEIVQILRLHPGLPAPTEFYTTRIIDSYDLSRVGMEPQLGAGSKRLQRLDDEAVDEIGRQRMDVRDGIHQRLQFPLFQLDVESNLSWFTPSPMCKRRTTSSGNDDDTYMVRYPIDVVEYEIVGIVMGLAMYNGILLEPCFPLALYRLWLSPHTLSGESGGGSGGRGSNDSSLPTMHDLLPLHPTVAISLQRLKEYQGNVETDFGCSYDLTRDVPFIHEDQENQSNQKRTQKITTIPWTETLGASIAEDGIQVTNLNVSKYVSDYIQFVLIDDCWSRADAMRRGFLRVVGCPALSLCSHDELELMLCGSPDVGDFLELKRVARYMGGYTVGSQVILWFWEIILHFSEIMKRKVLLFVTGSDRVPIKGLASLPFCIQRSGNNSERLPTAHSCFNILDLPEYSSKIILAERLSVALRHTEGFGLI